MQVKYDYFVHQASRCEMSDAWSLRFGSVCSAAERRREERAPLIAQGLPTRKPPTAAQAEAHNKNRRENRDRQSSSSSASLSTSSSNCNPNPNTRESSSRYHRRLAQKRAAESGNDAKAAMRQIRLGWAAAARKRRYAASKNIGCFAASNPNSAQTQAFQSQPLAAIMEDFRRVCQEAKPPALFGCSQLLDRATRFRDFVFTLHPPAIGHDDWAAYYTFMESYDRAKPHYKANRHGSGLGCWQHIFDALGVSSLDGSAVTTVTGTTTPRSSAIDRSALPATLQNGTAKFSVDELASFSAALEDLRPTSMFGL